MLPLFSKSFSLFNSKKENNSFFALTKLQKLLLNSLDFNDVVKKSVNVVLDELGYLDLGYRIVVLALIDEKRGVLQRISISETEEARKALQVTPVPFKDIVIPLNDSNSLLIKTIREHQILHTSNWIDILTPAYTLDEAVQVQKIVGIKTSMVYPIYARGKPLGTLIFSMFKNYEEVTEEEKILLSGFTDLVGLAVQNSLLYSSVEQTTKQLAVANEKLKQLDQLKDDFVSIASHELRTPMTAIRSYSWMALNRSDIPLSDKLKKYLERTLLSTERLINLVNDMLNISRIESGRVALTPTIFNMFELVTEAISEVEVKAREKNIHLQIQQVQLPQVFADPDKVHQILLNLIGNALKFTPQDGNIGVSFFTDGQMLDVSIKDSGVGISKDDQSRLFSKFGRLDNSYVAAATSGGTGLGLYICKSLIELMKGKIWANSDGPGTGTTFTFSLPIANSQVLQNAAQYTRKPQGEVKGLEPVAF